MARALWQYLKNYYLLKFDRGETKAIKDGYIRFYARRKPWRDWNSCVVDYIMNPRPEAYHPRYADTPDLFKKFRYGYYFYKDRKPWKRHNTYTQLRIRYEWSNGKK